MSATKNMADSYKGEEFDQLKRGAWTLEEDNLLIHYINCHGEGRWNLLAKAAGLKRTGKSCRLRWLNYLRPDTKRGNLTPQEQLVILQLHSKWGNRWSKIARHLPGRTDNEIKNYWRTRVQKQARHLKIDSSSKMFVEALHRFWMPRLLEKVDQASYSSSSLTASCTSTLALESTDQNKSISDHLQTQNIPSPPQQTTKGYNSSIYASEYSSGKMSQLYEDTAPFYNSSLLQNIDCYNINDLDVIDSFGSDDILSPFNFHLEDNTTGIADTYWNILE